MNHHFRFPIATLTYNGNLIIAAAQAHPEIAPRLPATFIADANTALAKVTADVTDQKNKKGELGNLTAAQQTALDQLQSWMSKARKTARLAFPGQTVKLHQEFQVGINEPHDLASILNRADIIIASLQTAANLPALQAKGWTAADTLAFANLRETFPVTTSTNSSARGDARTSTTTKNADAADLYDRLLAIQNAADLQWPVDDPANSGIRDEFRLNIFPPGTDNGDEPTPPAPPTASDDTKK
jgi:hypothetical protein